MRASLRAVVVLALLAVSAVAVAQTTDASGQGLLRFMPQRLDGHARQDPTAYSSFATAAYRLDGGVIATLQIHEVRGAGAAEYQQSRCTRRRAIHGHEACVSERPGTVSLVWVFSDAIQVMLGAPDEATAVAMAQGLDLAAIAALAATIAG